MRSTYRDLSARIELCAVIVSAMTFMLALSPARAQSIAESVAILPLRTERGADPKIVEATQEGVVAYLEKMRFQILDPKLVRKKVPRAYNHDCLDATCLDALRQEIGANHVLRVNVFYTRAGHSIGVTWVDREAISYGETTKLAEETPEAAREAAFNAMVPSHAQQQRGPGPWLAVDGKPAGATVRVNGTSVGTLPYYGRAQPGPNRVEVSKNGFETREQVVEIPGNPEAFTQVQVDLERGAKVAPLAASTAEPSPTERETLASIDYADEEPKSKGPHALDYVTGIGLIAAGAAIGIAGPLQTAINDGECRRSSCSGVVGWSGSNTMQLIVGGGAVVSGALVLYFQPFANWSVTAGPESVSGSVSWSFQ